MDKKQIYIFIGIAAIALLVFAVYQVKILNSESGVGYFGSHQDGNKEAETKQPENSNLSNDKSNQNQQKVISESEYSQLLSCLNRELQEMGYELPGRVSASTKGIAVTNEKVVLTKQLSDNKSSKEIKELARTLNMSEEELNKLIAESRSYTDEIYKELAEKLDASYEELKEMILTALESDDFDGAANNLGITEDKLYAAIAATKELTDTDIEALARKLNMNYKELQELLNKSVDKVSKELETASNQLNTEIVTNKEEADANAAALQNVINILEDNVSSNKNLTDTDIADLVDSLSKVSNSLQTLSNRAVQKESYDQGSNTLYLTAE